mgnify:CR=1 FL=1
MNLKAFHQAILKWYDAHGRKNLPWRTFDTPLCDERLQGINAAYGVYISEIMLQQTQVNRVLEHFYFPFLKKFPNLTSLSNADESELLKAWQGLGYYSRARNLKLCASECVAKFDGVLPSEVSELRKLKGIGTYTAGAIACFGYKKAVSFIDGNIKRVFSRLFALSSPTQRELEAKASKLLYKQNAFDYNQALIDLGALVCTPKGAKCGICPLYEFCAGKFAPQKYPQNKKVEYEKLNLSLLVACFKGKIAIQKSTQKLYKGLYNLPQIDDELAKKCKIGAKKACKFIGEFKHAYTKYRLNVRVYECVFDETAQNACGWTLTREQNGTNLAFFKECLKACEFVSLHALRGLPLSNLAVKALKKAFKDEI